MTNEDCLPDRIWAWTNSVGAQKWSDEKIVSHSREYVSAARGDEPGEWVPVEDGTHVDNDESRYTLSFGGMLVVLDDHEDAYGNLASLLFSPDIRLCRRVAEPSSEAKTLESANEYIAELEREIMDLKGMMDTHAYAVLPDEDAQVLELVRLMREDIDKTDDGYKFNVYLIIYPDKIQLMDRGRYVELSEAIRELRSRNPKPPQRPTAEDWYQAWNEYQRTGDDSMLRKWTEQWDAADKHDADAPQKPTAEELAEAIRKHLADTTSAIEWTQPDKKLGDILRQYDAAGGDSE